MKDATELVLTDPRIASNKYRLVGPQDSDMMQAFLKNHKCNRFCSHLMLPPVHDLGVVGETPLPTPDLRIIDRLVDSTATALRDIAKS